MACVHLDEAYDAGDGKVDGDASMDREAKASRRLGDDNDGINERVSETGHGGDLDEPSSHCHWRVSQHIKEPDDQIRQNVLQVIAMSSERWDC